MTSSFPLKVIPVFDIRNYAYLLKKMYFCTIIKKIAFKPDEILHL